MKDHSCSWIIWSIIVILTLAIGIYAGYKVMKAISDVNVMDLEAELETANASLADANVELEFWQNTMTRLSNGEQFPGVDLSSKPSEED
jgi:maleate cis-trans isomerase